MQNYIQASSWNNQVLTSHFCQFVPQMLLKTNQYFAGYAWMIFLSFVEPNDVVVTSDADLWLVSLKATDVLDIIDQRYRLICPDSSFSFNHSLENNPPRN